MLTDQKMREMFQKLETDKTGSINRAEIIDVIKNQQAYTLDIPVNTLSITSVNTVFQIFILVCNFR